MNKPANTKETELKFQFRNIELIESCINAPNKQLAEDTVFHFELNLEHRVTLEGDLVIVVCSVRVMDATKDQIFGKLKAGCIFEVDALSQYFDENTGKHILPQALVLTINSISISTIRGVLFSLFRGTWLHNAVLPIIDPKEVS